MTDTRLNPLATYGLFLAWAVHDAEELARGPRWLRENLPGLRERFPEVPEAVWRAAGRIDEREFAAAVGVMAVIVAAAAAAGVRSGGRSAFYQGAVTGFGLHGLVHLAQAAAVRDVTPGSVTSPLVVIPFSLWARGRLRRAGVLRPVRLGGVVAGLAVAAGATVVSHAVGSRIAARF
ncbi:HXXEE domain-containing protein [Streptomyces sp. NPDC057494]|uniref:HXXEE domain-containing protein n=1 Tax=Streptomyces sp. NPDC057494 TaxID=3346148 RepID=UPI0036A2C407